MGYNKGQAKEKVNSYKCLHLKKKKIVKINNLMMYLKCLEKQE
jgi:hypothetical protein